MKKLFTKSLLASACMLLSATVLAVPVVDGFKSAGEYSHSFVAGWYNGHNKDGSQFQKSDNHTTNVYYENDNLSGHFYLYIEAPLAVKNMIWGNGFNDAEALLYYQHWCSPDDGNTAAIDGNNCDHHKDGFDTFKNKKTDFKGMTGSEKVIFGSGDKNIKFNLNGDVKNDDHGDLNNFYGGVMNFADSVDYVTTAANGIGCNTTNCDASGFAMAFELKFGNSLTDDQIAMLISNIQATELEFHLSPERGGVIGATLTTLGTSVPEPSSIALLGLGLAAFRFSRRKKKA